MANKDKIIIGKIIVIEFSLIFGNFLEVSPAFPWNIKIINLKEYIDVSKATKIDKAYTKLDKIKLEVKEELIIISLEKYPEKNLHL